MDIQKEIKGSVLFFNVEQTMVSTIQEEFRTAGVRVWEAGEPALALKMVQKEKVDIVLADCQDSGCHSSDASESRPVAFLKTVRKKYPATNRIALSREEQRGDVIQLLLKGFITSYFELPGSEDQLLRSILHVLYARHTLHSQKLLDLLNSAEILPVFPKTYNEFTSAIENDRSIKEISQIIEKDVSIATRVLRIANSDFFRMGRIGSIERAGIYLGLDTIKNIVFAVALSSIKKLGPIQQQQLERIILHSVQVNQNFQRVYATQTGQKVSDQFATIGITHDIGKVIMLQYLPKRFMAIVKHQKANPDIGFYRSELELGFEGQTHAEIGAYFLDLWNFPETSVYTALFHHSTEEFAEPYREILDVFAIVNELANKGDHG